MNKYLHDKSPQIFRPRVTPDPAMQSRLAEKLREVLERDQKYSNTKLTRVELMRTSMEMN